MVGPLVLALVIIAVVAWAGRRAMTQGGPRVSDGSSIRRFFTYAALLGLLVVAGNGVAGLLGGVLDVGRPPDAAFDDALAQQTAFAVVGVPLYVLVALWTRSRVRTDPTELRSRGLALYLTAASVLSIVLTVQAVQATVGWAIGVPFSGGAQFAELIVWGGSWLAHREVERRVVGRDVLTWAGFFGAVIGLGVSAAGGVTLLGDLFGRVLRIPTTRAPDGPSLLQVGIMALAAGLPVWAVCWLLPGRRLRRGTLWHVHVLLVGVAGGLLTAVVGASVALDRVVVWLVRGADTSVWLEGLPLGLGALVVGCAVWAYHRAVLRVSDDEGRTEVRRAYDYLLAGVGLVAAAVGLVVMIVAGLEGLGAARVVLAGGGDPVDTVVAAATLLAVGGPVWWVFWRRLERAVDADPVGERRSRSRRVYVLLLFGVSGTAAVVALLAGAVSVLQDVYAGTWGPQTLQAVRYPIGIIVTAGLVAAYHFTVLRADRDVVGQERHGPRYVLLVGPSDPEVVRALHRVTGGTVDLWARTDTPPGAWSVPDVTAALADLPAEAVLVLADEHGGLRAIPVTRP